MPRGPVTRGPKPGPARDDGPQRIAKLLARVGIASRREIERMIADGRIALNGEKIITPATVLDSLDGIVVDGKPVRPAAASGGQWPVANSTGTPRFDASRARS